MFKLKFRATQHVSSLSEVLNISSAFTPVEAYGRNGEELGVGINFNDLEESTVVHNHDFQLYQNIPNPFTQSTVIGFELPQAMMATLIIRDVSGREVLRISDDYEKGHNEITIKRFSLSSGVYYYSLVADGFTASRKMIINE